MSRVVNCPTCGTKVEWIEQNAARPFCSERCKLIDLGAWAAEAYRVAEDNDAGSTVEHDIETEPPVKS